MKFIVVALLCLACSAVGATAPTVTAKSVLVLDADSGNVLLGKNDDTPRPIASITKLIGGVVIVKDQLDLNERITITEEDVEAAKPTGHTLPIGTTLTRRELLQLSLMNSQNRAAAALARTYPGGTGAFLDRVRGELVALGMNDTSISEPTGLYPSNVSTAADLAKLVVHAAELPLISELSTAEEAAVDVKSRPRTFSTTNGLVKMPDWDVLVQKTGYINDAGRCMVMMTTIGAQRVVMVLLGSSTTKTRRVDVVKLRDWVRHKLTPER